jgi:hypothetical protein
VELAGRDFKRAIINLLKDSKKSNNVREIENM